VSIFIFKSSGFNLDASLNIVIYVTWLYQVPHCILTIYTHFNLGRVGAATTGEAVAVAGAAGPGAAATTTTTGLPAAAAGDSAGEGTTTTTGGDGAVAAAATTTGTCCVVISRFFYGSGFDLKDNS